MMRALVMDFASDKQALDINNQYMFGKSLLVCPVTELMYADSLIHGKETTVAANFSKPKPHPLYLPESEGWIDFWSGEKLKGGQTIVKEAPIDLIPLYVRAGAIVPLGPKVQYATEKKWDALEIRVYPGANGEFTLYEDENDNYDYEKGMYSTITFTWDDAKRVLTINDRNGSFPGMVNERKFCIVGVTKNNGIGMEPVKEYDEVITYSGKKVMVKL
jgi:alpha-D-xyloside xylohydrolase